MISVAEQNYYKDIHKIALTLAKIEHHLSTIAVTTERNYAVEPVWFDPEEHIDDGK